MPAACAGALRFNDAGLERAVRALTGKAGDLYYEDVKDITALRAGLYAERAYGSQAEEFYASLQPSEPAVYEVVSPITSISGIECLTSLVELTLNYSQISDLSPLSALTRLEVLEVFGSPVSDLAPLASLTNLTHLDLGGSGTSDISTTESRWMS